MPLSALFRTVSTLNTVRSSNTKSCGTKDRRAQDARRVFAAHCHAEPPHSHGNQECVIGESSNYGSVREEKLKEAPTPCADLRPDNVGPVTSLRSGRASPATFLFHVCVQERPLVFQRTFSKEPDRASQASPFRTRLQAKHAPERYVDLALSFRRSAEKLEHWLLRCLQRVSRIVPGD